MWVRSGEVDEPGACYIEWSKSERENQIWIYMCMYICINIWYLIYIWDIHTYISSVQSLSHVQFFATPGTAAHQLSLSITNSQSQLKCVSITSVVPSSHLILCHSLLLPSIFPSIRVFSNESVLHIRWPKYWSFSFSISPSNEYSGLISFRMDWLDLLAVQGTLKSLLQHHTYIYMESIKMILMNLFAGKE